MRLKLPPPFWRWETGDGCGPSANANNKTSTWVTPNKALITLTADQNYRSSEGVKAERGDIDSSLNCLLGRQKLSNWGPGGWCSPVPPTAARTDTTRISPFLSTSKYSARLVGSAPSGAGGARPCSGAEPGACPRETCERGGAMGGARGGAPSALRARSGGLVPGVAAGAPPRVAFSARVAAPACPRA